MRTIELDTDVFSRIWAHRRPGEETENEILRRLLGAPSKAGSGRKPPSPSPKPDDTPRGHARARWRDDVRRALEELGGTAALDEIYRKVISIRRAAGRSLPPSTDAVIRRELENNSSDSDSFTQQRDWFAMPHGKGAGIWSLRQRS